jgi:hypothetical protein
MTKKHNPLFVFALLAVAGYGLFSLNSLPGGDQTAAVVRAGDQLTLTSPKGGEVWTLPPTVTNSTTNFESYVHTFLVNGADQKNISAFLEEKKGDKYTIVGQIPNFAPTSYTFSQAPFAWVAGVVAPGSCPSSAYDAGAGGFSPCLNASLSLVPPGQYYVHILDTKTNKTVRTAAPISLVRAVHGSLSVLVSNEMVSQSVPASKTDNVIFQTYMLDATKSDEDVQISNFPAYLTLKNSAQGMSLTNCTLSINGTPLTSGQNLINPRGNTAAQYSFVLDRPLVLKKGTNLPVQLSCKLSPSAFGTFAWGLSKNNGSASNAVGVTTSNAATVTVTANPGLDVGVVR